MTAIYPTTTYRDAAAAIDFLCTAFGFERHDVHAPEGEIVHAELRLGDAFALVAAARGGMFDTARTVVYVAIDDVDAMYERAREAGAKILLEPFDTDYGSRDFSAEDPEGNVWAFGTYRPGAGGS